MAAAPDWSYFVDKLSWIRCFVFFADWLTEWMETDRCRITASLVQCARAILQSQSQSRRGLHVGGLVVGGAVWRYIYGRRGHSQTEVVDRKCSYNDGPPQWFCAQWYEIQSRSLLAVRWDLRLRQNTNICFTTYFILPSLTTESALL